jgi:hypothetical protein
MLQEAEKERKKKIQEELEKTMGTCCVCGGMTTDKDTCKKCLKFVHIFCAEDWICNNCKSSN